MTEPSDARPEETATPSSEKVDGRGEPPGSPEPQPVVVHDKRRVSATGGREDAGAATPGGEQTPARAAAQPAGNGSPQGEPAGNGPAEPGQPAGLGAELTALRTELDERTRDLQRVTAEFANYRKRVERDKARSGEQATANLLTALLPVLDDLDRAREHGELADGVAVVADQLVATLNKFGLTGFGEKGDPFDPNRHEAVAHLTSPEVTVPTCVDVLRRGYLLGDRLLRAAMVAVADPAPASTATEAPAADAAPAEAAEPAEQPPPAESTESAEPTEQG